MENTVFLMSIFCVSVLACAPEASQQQVAQKVANCHKIEALLINGAALMEDGNIAHLMRCTSEKGYEYAKLEFEGNIYMFNQDQIKLNTKLRAAICNNQFILSFGHVEPDDKGNYFDNQSWALNSPPIKVSETQSAELPMALNSCEE